MKDDKWLQEGLDAIDYAGKQKTEEEHRDLFLKHVQTIIDCWLNYEDKTTRERMEGCVFSVLVALDGGSVGLPPYELSPMIEGGDGEWESSGVDIAGCLHDCFARYRR